MMDNLRSNTSKTEAARNASVRMAAEKAEKAEKAEAEEAERIVEVESIAAEKVEAD